LTKPSDHNSNKWGRLALFVVAAIVLLVFVWTHVR
jgi:hypothetical protein